MLALGGSTRAAGLVGLAILSCAGLMLASLRLGGDAPVLLILPAVVAAIVVAGLVMLYAVCGSAPATMAFLFVLVFVNDALFRVREPGDIGLDWQNAMKLALWAAAAAIGAGQLVRAWPRLATTQMRLLLLWLGIAMLSCFYSASATYSFATAFGMLGMLLLAAGMAGVLTEKQILLTFALSQSVFAVAGWVTYYAVPDLGRSPFITADGSIVERICGLAGQANALGCCLACLLAAAFLLWYRGHCSLLTVLPMGAIGLFTLLWADSRTALLAFVIGAAATISRRSLWRWGSAMLAGSLGVILVAVLPLRMFLGATGGLTRSGDPSELVTLTGRTEIWAFVWDKVQLQPWFGYGYNSSKFILPLFLGLPGLQVDEAHNTWLQNLLGTGVVGTAPLVLFTVVGLFLYVRAPNPFRDLMLFILLVWGITVAGAFGSTPTVMTLLVLTSLMGTTAARPPGAPA